MPILVIPLALLAAVAALILLMPLSLVLRYRAGTSRRLARRWVATVNVAGLAFSVALFLTTAAITGAWVPDALRAALAGLGVGAVLGLIGLLMTRWEPTPQSLHYTPSRLLVLAVMLAVAARMVYGVWRAWHAWQTTPDDLSWLASAGAAGSLAAGAVVLGYYFVYWAGVRRRILTHARSRWTARSSAPAFNASARASARGR